MSEALISARYNAWMIWLFERGDRVTRFETRFDSDQGEYVLDAFWSDGTSTTERFADAQSFKSRLEALERKMVAEEWKQSGGSPQLTEDWWKP